MYVTSYDEHQEALAAVTAKILTPDLAAALKKRISDELTPIWEAAVNEVIEGAAESVSRVAAERAKKFLEAVLAGDEGAARNLFGLSGFTGRERDRTNPGFGPGPVIHGEIFEAEPIKLRRQIVTVHADLLRDARIVDLEDLLEGARRQIDQLQKDDARRRGFSE